MTRSIPSRPCSTCSGPAATASPWTASSGPAPTPPSAPSSSRRAWPSTASSAPPPGQALIITVKQGSQGDAVRGVQEEFQFRNLSGDPSTGLAVDGIFGPATDAAVRGFQQALHLDIASVTVDGIVGPVTWQALVSGMLSF